MTFDDKTCLNYVDLSKLGYAEIMAWEQEDENRYRLTIRHSQFSETGKRSHTIHTRTVTSRGAGAILAEMRRASSGGAA